VKINATGCGNKILKDCVFRFEKAETALKILF
jgi:hypothetical protein